MTRFADNLAPLWRKLREARTPPNAIRPLEIAGLVLAALVVVAIIGIADDARAYAWSTALPDGWYRFFAWLTRYGKSDWLLIPLGVVALLVSACDWRATSRPLAAAWREIGLLAAVAFLAIALPGLVTDLIKPLVGRFRPGYVPFDAFAGAFAFAPLSFGGYSQYSFPSGHSTTVSAVAVLAVLIFGRWSAPIVLTCGLVAVSRVVVGAHFPSDVVAGLFVGGLVAFLIIRISAVAGFGFVQRPDGAILPRVEAVRTVAKRSGFVRLAAAFGTALVGRRRIRGG